MCKTGSKFGQMDWSGTVVYAERTAVLADQTGSGPSGLLARFSGFAGEGSVIHEARLPEDLAHLGFAFIWLSTCAEKRG
jgi:hypothetical protein